MRLRDKVSYLHENGSLRTVLPSEGGDCWPIPEPMPLSPVTRPWRARGDSLIFLLAILILILSTHFIVFLLLYLCNEFMIMKSQCLHLSTVQISSHRCQLGPLSSPSTNLQSHYLTCHIHFHSGPIPFQNYGGENIYENVFRLLS